MTAAQLSDITLSITLLSSTVSWAIMGGVVTTDISMPMLRITALGPKFPWRQLCDSSPDLTP